MRRKVRTRRRRECWLLNIYRWKWLSIIWMGSVWRSLIEKKQWEVVSWASRQPESIRSIFSANITSTRLTNQISTWTLHSKDKCIQVYPFIGWQISLFLPKVVKIWFWVIIWRDLKLLMPWPIRHRTCVLWESIEIEYLRKIMGDCWRFSGKSKVKIYFLM